MLVEEKIGKLLLKCEREGWDARGILVTVIAYHTRLVEP